MGFELGPSYRNPGSATASCIGWYNLLIDLLGIMSRPTERGERGTNVPGPNLITIEMVGPTN